MDLGEKFEDESVGTYRCQDPAANLNIMITVTHDGSANQQAEELTVHWQQKVFSPAELRLYSGLESPETELEKRYKEETTALLAAAQPPTNTIFTHVQTEQFVEDHERSRSLMVPEPARSRLSETLTTLRFRRPTPPGEEVPDSTAAPDQDESTEVPTATSLEQRLRTLSLTTQQTMFIMLYAQEAEHVLCRLDWSTSGLLVVRPDFSPGKRPYRLQVGEGQKGVYGYRLQWQRPGDETTPAGPPDRAQVSVVAGPAGELSLPAAGTLLVVLSGQLVSARGFDRDNLFIHFFVELPNGWRASADTRLWGITQLSRASAAGHCHFGFPIQAELVYGSPDDQQQEAVHRWPTLYLEVLSEDALGVCRTEGYCHLVVPPSPGVLLRHVTAWRPVADRRAQLRRHFIGGSPELEDPSFVAVPAGFQGDRLSRYGFRTETTGEVVVRLTSLHQSRAFLDGGGGAGPRPAGTPAAASAGVAAVLEAFKRARLRMLRARERLEAEGAGRAAVELNTTRGRDGAATSAT